MSLCVLTLAILIVSVNCTFATSEDLNSTYNNTTTFTVNNTISTYNNTTTTDTQSTYNYTSISPNDTNAPTSNNESIQSQSASEQNGNSAAAGETSFTIDQIKQAATQVKNYIETNKKLPDTITIGTATVTMPQFLELLTTATIQINNNNFSTIPLKTFTTPTCPMESITSGNIYKTEYLAIANSIKNYMDSTGKTPDFYTGTSLGSYIRYENLIYMYSKIMDYYNTTGQKAAYVAMTSWYPQTYNWGSEFDQYLVATANCQSNDASIQSYVRGIVGSITDPYSKALAIFNWVNTYVGYSFYYNSQKGALGVLNGDGTGNCCDISHVLVAFFRAAGLPARYEHGNCYFTTSGQWYGHVWAQVYVGYWLNADASSDRNGLGVINNWDKSSYTSKGIYASLPF